MSGTGATCRSGRVRVLPRLSVGARCVPPVPAPDPEPLAPPFSPRRFSVAFRVGIGAEDVNGSGASPYLLGIVDRRKMGMAREDRVLEADGRRPRTGR